MTTTTNGGPTPPPVPPPDPPAVPPTVPPAGPPPAPPLLPGIGRTPGAPGATLLAAVAAVGVLAAALVPGPVGVGWTALGWAMLAVGSVLVHRRRVGRRDAGRADVAVRRLLVVLAAVLCLVPSLSASPWLVAVCLLAAAGTATAAAVDARTWPSLVLAPCLVPVGVVLAVPWVAAGVRRLRLPAGRPTSSPTVEAPGAASAAPSGPGAATVAARSAEPWVRALVVTVPVVCVVAALLASADEAFAAVLRAVVPRVDLAAVVGRLPARLAFAAVVLLLLLGVLRAALLTSRTSDVPRPPGRRPLPEWAVPLLATDLLLAAFLAVQATMLFGGADVVAATGTTYAERARQGFGQLALVTVITLGLVAWAGARCDARRRRDRRARDLLAGALVLLSLALVASALHRMALYQEAYGYTVRRYVVVVLEVGIAALLALAALGRYPAVARLLPRLAVAVAATTVLVLGVTRPDAVVAAGTVDRFQATGQLDAAYAATLSDDAVPALAALPPQERWCAIGQHTLQPRGLLGANLAAHGAARHLPLPVELAHPCDEQDLPTVP